MTEKAKQIKIDDENLAQYKEIADKLSQNEKILALKDKEIA